MSIPATSASYSWTELESIRDYLVNALLAATLINELLAPPISKFALARSGEAGQVSETAP